MDSHATLSVGNAGSAAILLKALVFSAASESVARKLSICLNAPDFRLWGPGC